MKQIMKNRGDKEGWTMRAVRKKYGMGWRFQPADPH